MAKSVCIVGAGPSGIVAAKTLLHNAPKKDEFTVTMFETQDDIGGLWPTSKEDTHRHIHPFMVANQSRHTVQFSEQAWKNETPQFPMAWQIGQYLRDYFDKHLKAKPGFQLHLRSRISRAERRGQGSKGHWDITVQSLEGERRRQFDYLLISSGFFGKPIMPEALCRSASVPVIHSSQYRNLKGLLGGGKQGGGKILIIGGQMSGVEIAGTVASHLSSAVNSPDGSAIVDVNKYSIHHVMQRPIWVFPLFTSPEPNAAAAPFLPVDFAAYNRNERPRPLSDSQGHISEATARNVHQVLQQKLGNNQSIFSPLLAFNDCAKSEPPYVAMSDWFCDFVRLGLIRLSRGKVDSIQGDRASVASKGEEIEKIAAVILATGFDSSPCIDFLADDILSRLQFSPRHTDLPVALAFHGSHHPDVPGLGFVGFYRAPYWGVMQMQARLLTELWSGEAKSEALLRKLEHDRSIQRTLDLRCDCRVSQFPMGDYQFLMQEFAEALGLDVQYSDLVQPRSLSLNEGPLDFLSPSRYQGRGDDDESRSEGRKSVEDALRVAEEGLTMTRFVPRAVFRSLLGTWRLERDVESRLPSHPSGHFSGTAQFLLREMTSDGLPPRTDDGIGMEYLYVEDGEFKTESGFGFRATRRYIWRYDEHEGAITVWFAKPEDQKRADYLFHKIEFQDPAADGWRARAGHLCVDDYYDVKYRFAFEAVNLKDWDITYLVRGPRKDYSIRGAYGR